MYSKVHEHGIGPRNIKIHVRNRESKPGFGCMNLIGLHKGLHVRSTFRRRKVPSSPNTLKTSDFSDHRFHSCPNFIHHIGRRFWGRR
ncbi:unnamed protein product [Lactuca virosa]|uniref:Ribosomal protein L2 n=1 Tax=Lactuca virosa TaxID=75947 RepID=A0AAU9PQE5_9ASTR|nr:unnamed protein product [Lactuca virosa]